MRKRDIERAIKAVEKAIEYNNKMEEKYSKKVKKELEEVGKRVIDDWYSDYIPNSYHRLGSLYRAFKVTVKNGSFVVDFSSEYMKRYKHTTGKKTADINEYIFDISFLQGWHGGANKGLGHPLEGIPYYREPYPYYSRWYLMSELSESPYDIMFSKMSDKIQEISNEYDKEFDEQILKKINHHINILKGGTK